MPLGIQEKIPGLCRFWVYIRAPPEFEASSIRYETRWLTPGGCIPIGQGILIR